MSKSLQDQLKALGLAKDKPRKKSGKKPAVQRSGRASKNRKSTQESETAELSLERAFALRKQEEKRSADQARQRKQEEDRKRKQLNKAIRAIVKVHRLNVDEAEVARNFMFRGRIRKIYVTPDQLKALNAGELGIAYLSGSYHLVPKEQTDTVRQLSEEHVVDLAIAAGGDDGDFPIPDDLIW